VEVAAPIAMIGFGFAEAFLDADLGDAMPRHRRSLWRIRTTRVVDDGLTRIAQEPAYVYLTPNELAFGEGGEDGAVEVVGDRRLPACPVTEDEAIVLRCGSHTRNFGLPVTDNRTYPLVWDMPFLMAAVDPAAEAALVGLDNAVDSGDYLSDAALAPPVWGKDEVSPVVGVPVLYSSRATAEAVDEVVFEELPAPVAERIPGARLADLADSLPSTPGRVVWSGRFSAMDAHATLAETLRGPYTGRQGAYWTPAAATLTLKADGGLAAVPVPEQGDEAVWGVEGRPGALPPETADTQFRELTRRFRLDPESLAANDPLVQLRPVGTFDPTDLRGFSELSAVPLTTYQPPRLRCGDPRSCDLLGGRDLLPNLSPGGYLQQPPLVLTAMTALPAFYSNRYRQRPDGEAPVSAVRVRVAGITGFDPLSRERVRRVAEDIATATGLDVDITLGSSPVPQRVDLPAGKFGRPALELTEDWTKKGVAAAIVRAIDRKSLVLFGLILVVCVLFLANAVSAAVRDRRRELAVLACMGWPRRGLAALVTGEVALLGLAGGGLAALASIPLAAAVGVQLSAAHAALAVPVALGVALVSALVPAWGASRAHPRGALHPAARRVRRWGRRPRTVGGLAAINLWRVPGRTLLGTVALAVGVAGLTVVSAVTWAFHGSVTGSLLGDAVSLRVRGVDLAAVAATVALGLVAVADVLYLNVRDRAGELAALNATGWSDAALGRLVTYEGVGIGVLGAASGAAIGLFGAAQFAGTGPRDLLWPAAAVVAVAVLAAGAAALVPASLQRRLPVSALLAEE
jgi:hypothetical protein